MRKSLYLTSLILAVFSSVLKDAHAQIVRGAVTTPLSDDPSAFCASNSSYTWSRNPALVNTVRDSIVACGGLPEAGACVFPGPVASDVLCRVMARADIPQPSVTITHSPLEHINATNMRNCVEAKILSVCTVPESTRIAIVVTMVLALIIIMILCRVGADCLETRCSFFAKKEVKDRGRERARAEEDELSVSLTRGS